MKPQYKVRNLFCYTCHIGYIAFMLKSENLFLNFIGTVLHSQSGPTFCNAVFENWA